MKKLSAPWTLKNEEVLKTLETNISTGLSSSEASRRLEKFGLNVLKVEKRCLLL